MTEDEIGLEDPDFVDLREALRPVGDQGPRGTCVAFAVTAVHEYDRTALEVTPDDLAEEVLFWGAKELDGDKRDGTRFSSADRALRQWGQPAEELWPYDGTRDHRGADYHPPPDALDSDNCHMSALRPIEAARESVELEVAARIPVVLGIPVWDAFRSAASQPIHAPGPSELYPTRHAVVVVGFDRSQDAILVRNSWGPGWGDNGHSWIDVGLLTLAAGAWAIDSHPTPPSEVNDVALLERSPNDLR